MSRDNRYRNSGDDDRPRRRPHSEEDDFDYDDYEEEIEDDLIEDLLEEDLDDEDDDR